MEKSAAPNTIFESGIHNESPSIYYEKDRNYNYLCQLTQHCREKKTPIDPMPMGVIHGSGIIE
jgi:hypothetical protein